MTRDQAELLAVGGPLVIAVLVAVVALLVALLRVRAGATRTAEELSLVRRRLDDLEHERDETPAPTTAAATSAEFVITDLGQQQPQPEAVHLDGPTFADIVLKETVVKAASLAHGVRRGLRPATRNRIRFEMKQEVRRARKQRRADLKAAQRDLRARQRAMLAPDGREAS